MQDVGNDWHLALSTLNIDFLYVYFLLFTGAADIKAWLQRNLQPPVTSRSGVQSYQGGQFSCPIGVFQQVRHKNFGVGTFLDRYGLVGLVFGLVTS